MGISFFRCSDLFRHLFRFHPDRGAQRYQPPFAGKEKLFVSRSLAQIIECLARIFVAAANHFKFVILGIQTLQATLVSAVDPGHNSGKHVREKLNFAAVSFNSRKFWIVNPATNGAILL